MALSRAASPPPPSAALYHYPPAWNAPSYDPMCLTMMSLMKFAGYPVKLRECEVPEMSPSEELPFLRLPDDTLLVGDEICAEIRKNNDLNRSLTPAQQADHDAYLSLVRHKLHPALLYSMWCESDNFNKTTRPLVSRKLTFPLNYVIPMYKRWRVSEYLSSLRTLLDQDEMFDEAAQAMAALAQRLGDQMFFFGDKPTELDAHVFAYLHVIHLAPLPMHELNSCLQTHANLLTYTRHILQTYFISSS